MAGKMLAVLLQRLKAYDVPRRGWVFDVTRAGPQLYDFETKDFAVEALGEFEILVFQSSVGKSLGNITLARKLFCRKRLGPVRICCLSHARFNGMLVRLDLPIVPAGFVEMNRISVVVASRFDDLDAEFLFLPFQIFSGAIDFGVARPPHAVMISHRFDRRVGSVFVNDQPPVRIRMFENLFAAVLSYNLQRKKIAQDR